MDNLMIEIAKKLKEENEKLKSENETLKEIIFESEWQKAKKENIYYFEQMVKSEDVKEKGNFLAYYGYVAWLIDLVDIFGFAKVNVRIMREIKEANNEQNADNQE